MVSGSLLLVLGHILWGATNTQKQTTEKNPPWDGSRFAWYTTEAANFAGALPIGNGRLGAAIFGSGTEKVVLNENSVWSGPWQDRTNSASKRAVAGIRQMLQAGNLSAAGQTTMSNMAANPTSPRAYNPLVNMAKEQKHETRTTTYTRWLDTYQGTAGVTYVHGSVNYSREFVASYPHGVLAFRLSSGEPGKLNVKLSLSRDQGVLDRT